MEILKIECVNVQHAQIATMRLKGLGRRTVRMGKAVVTESDSDKWFIQAFRESLGYTCQPSEYDIKQLEREYE
jgi:hypothetical protein